MKPDRSALDAELYGISSKKFVPLANGPDSLKALSGRKAQLEYRFEGSGGPVGVATIEAPLLQTFKAIHVVSQSADNWRNGEVISEAIYKQAHQVVEAQSTIIIKLPGLTQESCIAAIEALTRNLSRYVKDKMGSPYMRFAFQTPGETMSEKSFYEHLERNTSAAAPALKKLVEKVISGKALPKAGYDLPWSDDYQLAGPAVKALALLDINSLPLVEKYCRIIDDHDCLLMRVTVPAIFKAYGWRTETIDLATSLMVITDEFASDQWMDTGLGEAISKAFTPQEFARKIGRIIEQHTPEESWQFGHYELVGLYRSLKEKNEWEIAFFEELDRLFPDYEEAA